MLKVGSQGKSEFGNQERKEGKGEGTTTLPANLQYWGCRF
jgi:hypothetical protein